MPRVTRSRDFRFAFVVGAEGIRRLIQAVAPISSEVKFTVKLSDETEIEFDTVDEVLAMGNTRTRRIVSLSLDTPSGREDYARVRLGEEQLTSASYLASGRDERNVLYVSDRIEQALVGMQQWYSRLAFLDYVAALTQVFIIISLFGGATFLGYTLARGSPPGKGALIPATPWNKGALVLIFVVLAFFLIAATLNLLRRRLFPVAVFLIGDGVGRYNSAVFWRRFVGGGLMISFVGSLLVALILR